MPVLFDNTGKNKPISSSSTSSPLPIPSDNQPQSVSETQKDSAPIVSKNTSANYHTPLPPVKPQTVEDESDTASKPEIIEPGKPVVSPIIKEHVRMLGAYVTHPKGFRFASQEKKEYVILYLRQHPITQIGWVLLSFLLVFGTPFILYALSLFVPITLPDEFKIVIVLFWYLIIASYIVTKFVLWYYDIDIVTNKRIIDIDNPYLLSQEIDSCLIEQVEEVTYKKFGLFTALFDYGDVYVQTAGAQVNIDFLKVPNPKLVVQTILNLKTQNQ